MSLLTASQGFGLSTLCLSICSIYSGMMQSFIKTHSAQQIYQTTRQRNKKTIQQHEMLELRLSASFLRVTVLSRNEEFSNWFDVFIPIFDPARWKSQRSLKFSNN